jgi:asparagine synthase (glutamine-hydrolysing)
MCGIAGLMTFDPQAPIDGDLLAVMGETLAHRGPDAGGRWVGAGVGLAHRRLSIIDLAGGDQPIGNEDGSVQVVFNGEIYNYRELKAELETKGHRFRTGSDTEVLVHLYEEMQERLVERLRGMFAFALWDAKRERLLLARDRVGLKPLYYCRDSERLLFGSEIKAILAWPGVSREIDAEGLEDYLTFGVVPGERSIFRHIRKLPPAHTLVLDRRNWNASPRKYWELRVEPDESRTETEWIEALSAKFDETVEAHRIADVPIGAFLSGGVDSSAVVASLMGSSRPIKTFSIGFQEEKFSELPYARMVAQRFGTEHIEEIVTADAVAGLDDLVHFYDEPFADSSAIPTMAVCRAARRHVKVALSGDGGDEAFGGYSRYAHDLREARLRDLIPGWLRRVIVRRAAAMWPKADWLPRPMRMKTALTNLALEPGEAYANTISICRPELRRQLMQGDVRRQINGYRPEERIARAFGSRGGDPLGGMISADVSMLLPDDFLTKVDRASMAVGLEVRPPLVDHEFLELAARVPSQFKVRNGETKWIFKRLCDRRLPRDVVWRKKQGFEIPAADWLRGPLRERFEDQVLSAGGRLGDYIDRNAVRRLQSAHLRQSGRHGAPLWSLLVLGCWMEHYCRGPSPATANRSGSCQLPSPPRELPASAT